MRYDVPSPADLVLDLLARADALAVAASAAIVAGDDARLSALLDDREGVIDAVVRVWHRAVGHPATADELGRVSRAATATLAAGLETRAAAQVARDSVVLELAALDARQQASQEYHTGAPQHSIDVVR
jgi:hypothetical protein